MQDNRKKRQTALAHPTLNRSWTLADQDRACREGWAIFEASRGGITLLEIERNDVNDPPFENAPHFEFDEDARAHVYKQACKGSRFHRRALRIHQEGRRAWRIENGIENADDEDLEYSSSSWIEEVLVLLARDRYSPAERARCAQALATLHGIIKKHSKPKNEDWICAELEDYIHYELMDD